MLKNLNIGLPYDPAIPVLGLSQKKKKTHKSLPKDLHMNVHSSLISISQKVEMNKMMEVEVDGEYICLQGYIRNTPSDTELLAEHQLRADRTA